MSDKSFKERGADDVEFQVGETVPQEFISSLAGLVTDLLLYLPSQSA